MENVTLGTVAKILQVTEESLKEFPLAIQNSMIGTVENFEPDTEENCREFYLKLHKLWEWGCSVNDMKELSEETGADFETLLSLDYQSQMNIYFEYAIDVNDGNENAIANLYENIRLAQEIAELPLVADLLETDCDELRKYSREVWVQLCGAYAMFYEERGNNSVLISELKNIIKNAEEEENV